MPKEIMSPRQPKNKNPQFQKSQAAGEPTSSPDRFLVRLIPFICAVLLLFVVVFVNHHLLKTGTMGSIARTVAQATHFPVAVVNGTVISYTSLVPEQKRIDTMVSRLYTNTNVSFQEKFRLALMKRIRDVILARGYATYGITVSPSDRERAFTQLFGELPTSEQAQSLVRQSLGMSADEFIDSLLSEYLMQAHLGLSLATDAKQLSQSRALADTIAANAASSPQSFAKLADAYNPNQVAYHGGVIVTLSDLADSFAAVKTCTLNALLPTIETDKTFTIIKCGNSLPAGEGGASSSPSYVTVDEIIVNKPNLPAWLSSQVRSARISVLTEGLDWRSSCQSVVLSGALCTKQAYSDIATSALQDLLQSSEPLVPPTRL